MLSCQVKHCPKELAKATKQKEQVRKETASLVNAFYDKKITLKQFEKKADALKSKILKSKETKDITRCSLEKCPTQTKQVVNVMVKIKQTECKKGYKPACKTVKKGKQIKTTADYISFMRTL